MIQFEQVTKIYSGHRPAVADLNLTIESGSFVALIGISGSGKTTCMRMINRMIDPTRGRILIDGQDIAQMPAVRLRRKIGYVIQQIGLMPHMTIFDNIVNQNSYCRYSSQWLDERYREAGEASGAVGRIQPTHYDRAPFGLPSR